MVDSHNRRTSGAVWFKHKYLTHPSVTPADRITAAIGGLAKTLTTERNVRATASGNPSAETVGTTSERAF